MRGDGGARPVALKSRPVGLEEEVPNSLVDCRA